MGHPAIEFLKRNGFRQKGVLENVLTNDKCEVRIYDAQYEIEDERGVLYSDNLNIYWLIGALTYRGFMNKEYKN
jgi:hypothetical protein